MRRREADLTDHIQFMRRAIALSKRGLPAPNPHVGCVIVRGGRIVGEGHHARAGNDHAEVAALRQALDLARDSTVYVTLEPCNHHGRTPPCTEALIRANVAEVYTANIDPNPKALGGLAKLQEHGIRAYSGLLSLEAAEANYRWHIAMRLKRPFVTVKAAISLDGKIALPSGESKWITGESARKFASRIRAEHSAILAGRRTVSLDDPGLLVTYPRGAPQPVAVVLDQNARLQGSQKVFKNRRRTALHFIGPEVDRPKHKSEVIRLDAAPFNPEVVLSELWSRGLTSVLVEGGSQTISAFMKAGLADEIHLYVAPKLIGEGLHWVQLPELERLSQAQVCQLVESKQLGQDMFLRYRTFELSAIP